MPVGPVAAFPDSGAVAMNEEGGPLPLSLTESLSPIDREAAEATSGSPSSAAAAEEGGDNAGVGGGDGEVEVVGMTAKERSRSVALSPGCRRCLNCETLYDLVRGTCGGFPCVAGVVCILLHPPAYAIGTYTQTF